MKKYLFSLTIFILLVIASMIFLPYLFKDQIVAAIKDEANKELKAQLDFNTKISINIFKSFPDLSLGIKEFRIFHNDQFEKDTLISIDRLDVTIDVMKFYKEQNYSIKKIELNRPRIQMEYVSDSVYNWDIFYPDTSTSESAIDLAIDKLTIKEGLISYLDHEYDMNMVIDKIDHESSGTYTGDVYTMVSATDIGNLFLNYEGVTYLNHWDVSQKGDIVVDLGNDKYGFKENSLFLNGIETRLDGSVQLIDDIIRFDLVSESVSSELNQYLTLVPSIYTSDYSSIKSEGQGALSMKLKGDYTDNGYPAFDVSLKIDNGRFQYPDLPYPVTDLNLNAHVFSTDGNIENTVVDLPVFKFNINERPFELSLYTKNLSTTPYIESKGKGAVDLADIMKVMPTSGYDLSGVLNLDYNAKGNVGVTEEELMSQIIASGSLQTEALRIVDPEQDHPIELSNTLVTIDNQSLNIRNLELKHGTNDVQLAGYVSNFFDYMYGEGDLKGRMDLTSHYLNLNDYTTTDTISSDSSVIEVIRIPQDLTLEFNAAIDELQYTDLNMNDVKGTIVVRDGVAILSKIQSGILGGYASLEGSYNSVPESPIASFDISFANIATDQLFEHFSIVRAFAPLLEQIKATTSAKLKFKSSLDQDMMPIISDVDIDGLFNLAGIQMQSMNALTQIDQKLGTSHFNVSKLEDLLLKFKVVDSKMWIDPFNLAIDQALLSLQGNTKIDGSIDYSGILKVPSSYVSNETAVVNGLIANSKFKNLEIKPDEAYDLGITIGGTILKPQVKLNMKEVRTSVEQNIRSSVNQEIDKRKDEAEDLLKKELDQLKDKSLDTANALKAELEKKKKEAEEELQKKKDEAKKELENKTKDALKKLFK